MTIVAAPNKAIAIIVMIAFIAVCVLAPFGAAYAIVGLSTAAVTILIAGLAAIGITFASTGGFDTLNEYVESLLQEYAYDNNIPITSIFNGTQYSSSAAGKLLINNRFVVIIQGFAAWLISKFSLSNNSTKTLVETGGVFGDFVTYSLPVTLRRTDSPQRQDFDIYFTEGNAVAIYYQDGNYRGLCIVADAPTTIHKITYNNSGVVTYNNNIDLTMDNIGSRPTYYYWIKSNPEYPKSGVNFNGVTYYTESQVDSALKTPNLDIDYNNIGVGIETGTITLPVDDVNFTSGDGAILDVGASWGETTSGAIGTVPDIWPQWLPQSETLTSNPTISIDYESEAVLEDALPQPSDIENLPGATIPGLPDLADGEPWHLEFGSLWHYVAQWISDMSAGGAVLWNVCIQAPPAIVNLVFAGIVLAMWFGAIKILR